jgi:hypothetical protein
MGERVYAASRTALAEAGRYYAAYLLDLDGNNVEAVRREF